MDEVWMPPVTIGQHISEEKAMLAKQMRRHMTPCEMRLWQRLRGNKMGIHFRRQQVLFGFIADFYCAEARLAIEVDGSIHDPHYDAERDRIFGERHIHVLRFQNDDVEQRFGYVLSTIRRSLPAP